MGKQFKYEYNIHPYHENSGEFDGRDLIGITVMDLLTIWPSLNKESKDILHHYLYDYFNKLEKEKRNA